MKQTEKRKKVKEILNYMFCNSYTWLENQDLTDGLTDEEIEEVSQLLDDYISSISRRYNL